MDVTIDLRTLGIIVVGIALLILIIYLVILIRNANIAVKKSHKLLDDLEEITDIASTRTVQLNDAADNLLDSIQDVSEALKGNQDLKKSVAGSPPCMSCRRKWISPRISEYTKPIRRRR